MTARLWACAAAMASLLTRAEALPPEAPQSRGVEIATAIATLVAAGQETDLEAVGAQLHLPELPDKVRWSGPRSRLAINPNFTADYRATGSVLGIMDVTVQWQPHRGLGFSTELQLLVEADACPSREELTRITAGHVLPGFRPSPDELILGVAAGRDDEIVEVRRLQPRNLTVDDKRVCTLYIDRRPVNLLLVQPLD